MRIYAVPFAAGTIPATNALDLWEISPADDKPVALLGVTLDNVGVGADAADAQEELLGITVQRGYTTSGSGGSTPVIGDLQLCGTAASFTAEVLNTTPATTTTAIVCAAFGWNVRVPCREFWPQELWPIATQANTTIVVRLAAGGGDAISANGTLYVAELA